MHIFPGDSVETRSVDAGGREVLVDLSRTTFIDSTALGVLIGVVKRLRPEGGELAIVCPEPSLRNVFEVTRLDRAFELFDSVEAADAISKSDAIKPLVEDFDRTWQGRVTRRRAVLEVAQEIEA